MQKNPAVRNIKIVQQDNTAIFNIDYPTFTKKMNQNFKDKITTYSLNGFKTYIRRHFIDFNDEVCLIKNCYICDQNCSTEKSLPNVTNLS